MNPTTMEHKREARALPPPDDWPDGEADAVWREDLLCGLVAVVAVLPEHRRRGIGAALIRLLVAEASSRGVVTVLLSASPDGLALYESLGFVVVGTLATAPPDPY